MACTKIYRPAFEIYQNVSPEEKSSGAFLWAFAPLREMLIIL